MPLPPARRIATAAALLAGVLFASAASASQVILVYPLPNSLVTESPAVVLGYVLGAPVAELEARVVSSDAGAPPRREPLHLFRGKIFSGSIPLEPGRNNVVVGDVVLPLLYRPGFEGEREGGFRRSLAHGGGIESCTPCHGFARGELTLKAKPPGLCRECHKVGTQSLRAVLRDNHHTRSVTPDCLRCHDPHVSFERRLVRSEENLCLPCHESRAKASRHDALGSQPCAGCHDPHASAYPKLLKGESVQLCRSCHQEVSSPARYPRAYHRPAEQGRCLDCHRPHPGESPALLRSPVPKLCRTCHADEDEGSHEGELEECRICHAPHMSGIRGLLTDNVADACVRCHGSFPLGESRHPGIQDGCVSCHNPHKPRALADPEKVCGSCHGLRVEKFRWTHGQLAMDNVRQCAFCHEPHHSRFPSLLRGTVHYPLKNGGCNACHVQEGKRIGLKYEGSKNCVRCHGQITGTSTIIETDKVHKPVFQIDCIACHNPHLGARENLLLEDAQVLCGWCHGILLRGVENIHGVFRKDGNCYTCHVSHISDFRPLLTRPQGELCARCHPDVVPEAPAERRKLHGVLRKGKCTGCHNPHGTNTERLLKGSRDELCRDCHPQITQGQDGRPWRYLHGPVGANDCTSCHDLRHAHAQNPDDRFLRAKGKALCSLCHDVPPEHVPERYRSKMREVRNECPACHVPHGAANPFLLRERL